VWSASRPSRLARLPYRLELPLRAASLASDLRSFLTMVRLAHIAPGVEATVRLRPHRGRPVRLRARTADLWTAFDLLPPVHLPPAEVTRPRRIWDLGANIGLTMVHMAVVYPEADIVGVEMDAANAALCRHNVAAWPDRCHVVEGAVWHEVKELSYSPSNGDESAYSVALPNGGGHKGDERTVTTVTLDGLLASVPTGELVDYVKMDIEGAERETLRHSVAWAQRVRSVRVEVHPPYTVDECMEDLTALGFSVSSDRRFWIEGRGWPVTGVRPDAGG
jgi:FkbM family methyltransferase